jgi:FtsP/CotA-like multicopper oxidase with cupredoxin domain
VGPIQIDGPASYEYDIDLGTFPISDWYYQTADDLLDRVLDPNNPFIAGIPGSPPPSDNVLFNGTNVGPQGGSGEYAKVSFTPGKRHRLRLINTSAENTFTISIADHSMTVISTDFVAVQPYPTDSVYLSVGQRLDIVIDANQAVGTYWLNATFSSAGVCGSSKNTQPAAIVQYDGAPWWVPDEPGVAPTDTFCADDTSPIPIVTRSAPVALFSASPTDTLNVSLEVNSTISRVYWEVNDSSIDVSWEKPTLQYVLESDSVFPSNSNVIELPSDSQVHRPLHVYPPSHLFPLHILTRRTSSGASG